MVLARRLQLQLSQAAVDLGSYEAALRALTAFESELGSGRIEAPRTYTNQFALRAKARFQA